MLFSKLTKIKCNVKFWITFTEIGIASTRWTTDMIKLPINYIMHRYKAHQQKIGRTISEEQIIFKNSF